MPQPLAGIKIADFSHVMAGPFCTHFLCMLGAEVIKVESPSGDPLRSYGPHRDLDGLSPAFIAANVGKKSIAVDLKSPGGHDAACRLIAASDVVIGGATIAARAFDAGLIDECHHFVYPVLVGAGKSAFSGDGPVQMTLLEEQRFDSGVVYLRYRIMS